jgi:hypothetical protein
MAAGDSELIGEVAAGEEALRQEAIPIDSVLKLVLDEEEVTVERIPSSDGDRDGRWWPTTMSRGG